MASLAVLSAKPWEGYPVPDRIYMPHGMVGFEERRMLYWLGAEQSSGAGTVVDAGAYLEHRHSPWAPACSSSNMPPRHVRWFIPMTALSPMTNTSGTTYRGASTRFRKGTTTRFEFQTALHADRIVAHRGDFIEPRPRPRRSKSCSSMSPNRGAQSPSGRALLTRLIPGKSVVVQQDFYQAWYPYIPITMEYFRVGLPSPTPLSPRVRGFISSPAASRARRFMSPPRRSERRTGGRTVAPRHRPRFRADPDDAARRRGAPSSTAKRRPDSARDAAQVPNEPAAYYADQLGSIEQYR